MDLSSLKDIVKSYPDFPKSGILFRDLLPVLENPEIFSELIGEMSKSSIIENADAIVAIDARGFIFGTGIALKVSKPLILARKPGKLPGDLVKESYSLEYGENTLCLQKDAISKYSKFSIVDDLLATGGTANSVAKILEKSGKKVLGLNVVIELPFLKGRDLFKFPVESIISY